MFHIVIIYINLLHNCVCGSVVNALSLLGALWAVSLCPTWMFPIIPQSFLHNLWYVHSSRLLHSLVVFVGHPILSEIDTNILLGCPAAKGRWSWRHGIRAWQQRIRWWTCQTQRPGGNRVFFFTNTAFSEISLCGICAEGFLVIFSNHLLHSSKHAVL